MDISKEIKAMEESRLCDFFSWELGDGDMEIIVYREDGTSETKKYEMTLSAQIPDSLCCRVKIDGKYYYFDSSEYGLRR